MTLEQQETIKQRIFQMLQVNYSPNLPFGEFEARYEGPPSVIDTFQPQSGDFGMDHHGATSPIRIWSGSAWSPNFGLAPRETEDRI